MDDGDPVTVEVRMTAEEFNALNRRAMARGLTASSMLRALAQDALSRPFVTVKVSGVPSPRTFT